MPKLLDEMIEAAGGDDSITNKEAVEDSASERVDQYIAKPLQSGDTRVGELLAEVNADSNVLYDLGYSKDGKRGQFRKIDNSIYYILSEKEKIGSQEEKSIAYNFSDLPFPMFIAYLVYSFLSSKLLLWKEPFTFNYVEGNTRRV